MPATRITLTADFEAALSQEPSSGTRKRLESVMDFACGSGSLLLNVRKQVAKAGGTIGRIYGQEKNITTYNLARMNMLLHGVKDTEFEIFHGDSLHNEWDKLRDMNPAHKPSFDAIVANPPFSYRWEPSEALAEDVRFKGHGLAPKSAADFAFLLHGFHYLGTPEKDFRASTSNSRQKPRVFEALIHADTGVVRFHKDGLRIPLDTLSDVQSPSKP